ncbi:hypothetical protein AKG98_1366 [Moritella sp. JT01]|uniref:hypothetical protein n=1 Tax=Moritella sp. JT01 TaxID=756698 RepID=UPI000796C579|nr:hypothetical protein [Moritella sp. JT01]KXO09156.1 hypothetical protein AKG98_1366 [Moritella sp. JT01]
MKFITPVLTSLLLSIATLLPTVSFADVPIKFLELNDNNDYEVFRTAQKNTDKVTMIIFSNKISAADKNTNCNLCDWLETKTMQELVNERSKILSPYIVYNNANSEFIRTRKYQIGDVFPAASFLIKGKHWRTFKFGELTPDWLIEVIDFVYEEQKK